MAERGRPLFSIGAVGRMLDLAPATIRTWEARYGHVVPQRSGGGQRLYSREQVDQLQFVKDQVAAGHRPAAAHRLLAERGDDFAREPPRVLLAESRLGAADSLRRLVGTDDFEVVVAADAETASRKVEELGLSLAVIDTDDERFERLSSRLRAAGTKVLPVALFERPLARLDEAGTPVPQT